LLDGCIGLIVVARGVTGIGSDRSPGGLAHGMFGHLPDKEIPAILKDGEHEKEKEHDH
jgi:hypothetical protein